MCEGKSWHLTAGVSSPYEATVNLPGLRPLTRRRLTMDFDKLRRRAMTCRPSLDARQTQLLQILISGAVVAAGGINQVEGQVDQKTHRWLLGGLLSDQCDESRAYVHWNSTYPCLKGQRFRTEGTVVVYVSIRCVNYLRCAPV